VSAELHGYNFDVSNNQLQMTFWTSTLAGQTSESAEAYMNDAADSEDSYTDNPANKYDEEADYVLATKKNKLKEIDEIEREMRKQQNESTLFGIVQSIVEDSAYISVRPNGPFNTAGAYNVYGSLVSPHQGIQPGCWVEIRTGQDSIVSVVGKQRHQPWIELNTGKLRKNILATDKYDVKNDADRSLSTIYYAGSDANGTHFGKRYPVFTDDAGFPFTFFLQEVALIRVTARVSGTVATYECSAALAYLPKNATAANLSAIPALCINMLELQDARYTIDVAGTPSHFMGYKCGIDGDGTGGTTGKTIYAFYGVQFGPYTI